MSHYVCLQQQQDYVTLCLFTTTTRLCHTMFVYNNNKTMSHYVCLQQQQDYVTLCLFKIT
jgi:hypothetical protein